MTYKLKLFALALGLFLTENCVLAMETSPSNSLMTQGDIQQKFFTIMETVQKEFNNELEIENPSQQHIDSVRAKMYSRMQELLDNLPASEKSEVSELFSFMNDK